MLVVAAHGFEPDRVGHAELAQQGCGALRVLGDGSDLCGAERLGLLRQSVLQRCHRDVHGQRRAAHLQHAHVWPAQHLVRHDHAGTGHQHRMRGAVRRRFLRRQVDQREQRGVRRLDAIAYQCVVQVLEAITKIPRKGCGQQPRGAQLQVGPVSGTLIFLARKAGKGLGTHRRRCDGAKRIAREQHFVQMSEIGLTGFLGLVHVQPEVRAKGENAP